MRRDRGERPGGVGNIDPAHLQRTGALNIHASPRSQRAHPAPAGDTEKMDAERVVGVNGGDAGMAPVGTVRFRSKVHTLLEGFAGVKGSQIFYFFRIFNRQNFLIAPSFSLSLKIP